MQVLGMILPWCSFPKKFTLCPFPLWCIGGLGCLRAVLLPFQGLIPAPQAVLPRSHFTPGHSAQDTAPAPAVVCTNVPASKRVTAPSEGNRQGKPLLGSSARWHLSGAVPIKPQVPLPKTNKTKKKKEIKCTCFYSLRLHDAVS